MKSTLLAAAVAMTATGVIAEPEKYTLDASHSQVMFSYEHLGFSTTYNMFSGFNGEILFDQDAPENSSVTVSIPVNSLFTGWEGRFEHFMGPDFFDAADGDVITFVSTSIEVTGDATALIAGDLTINDITKSVMLDAKLNKNDTHPMANAPWAGFGATATILRSDFGLGKFAPFVSDELDVAISIEAQKAE